MIFSLLPAFDYSCCCVGVYMLVITSRKEVGNFLGFPVFQVTSMKFLPCDAALKLSTSQEVCLFLIIPLTFLLTWSKSHLYPGNRLFWAEKRWSLFPDFVENSGNNSGVVLFIPNRYNVEVNDLLLQQLFKYSFFYCYHYGLMVWLPFGSKFSFRLCHFILKL